MKTYKDYIKEASYDDEVRNTKANRLYPEYLNLYGEIKRFVDACFDKYKYSDIVLKLIDGKDITADLKRYDSVAKSLADIVKNFKDTKYVKDIKVTDEILKKYDSAVSGYKKLQDMYKQIFSYLKIGDSIERAVPKLVEMCKKVKYYDIHTNKYTVPFFDEFDKDDFMGQIKNFSGTVKVTGASDLYVKFANNKLMSFYF